MDDDLNLEDWNRKKVSLIPLYHYSLFDDNDDIPDNSSSYGIIFDFEELLKLNSPLTAISSESVPAKEICVSKKREFIRALQYHLTDVDLVLDPKPEHIFLRGAASPLWTMGEGLSYVCSCPQCRDPVFDEFLETMIEKNLSSVECAYYPKLEQALKRRNRRIRAFDKTMSTQVRKYLDCKEVHLFSLTDDPQIRPEFMGPVSDYYTRPYVVQGCGSSILLKEREDFIASLSCVDTCAGLCLWLPIDLGELDIDADDDNEDEMIAMLVRYAEESSKIRSIAKRFLAVLAKEESYVKKT